MNKIKTLALALGAGIMAGGIPHIRHGREAKLMDDAPAPRNPPKRFKKHLSEYNTPPKSMSEGTAYLYNRKPNLAWWQQQYGENILDKSLAELHSMGI